MGNGFFRLVRRLPLLTALLAVGAPLAAKPLTDAQAAKLLADGRRVLAQGIPDVAISKYFQPVIDSYESVKREPGTKIFVARSTTETLIYSAMPLKQGTGGSVVLSDTAWVDALDLKAYALVEMQQSDAAEKVLLRALELESMDPTALAELGNVYQERKQWDKAAELYRQLESSAALIYEEGDVKNQVTARALRGQGFILTEQGKLDESEALYKRCLELDPHDSKSLNELAYIQQLRARQAAAASPAPSAPESQQKTE
jgi:tetratricopeptide (TPR) repeat protein